MVESNAEETKGANPPQMEAAFSFDDLMNQASTVSASSRKVSNFGIVLRH